jgi:hypothetical protein
LRLLNHGPAHVIRILRCLRGLNLLSSGGRTHYITRLPPGVSRTAMRRMALLTGTSRQDGHPEIDCPAFPAENLQLFLALSLTPMKEGAENRARTGCRQFHNKGIAELTPKASTNHCGHLRCRRHHCLRKHQAAYPRRLPCSLEILQHQPDTPHTAVAMRLAGQHHRTTPHTPVYIPLFLAHQIRAQREQVRHLPTHKHSRKLSTATQLCSAKFVSLWSSMRGTTQMNRTPVSTPRWCLSARKLGCA